jgi:hypothetical protein
MKRTYRIASQEAVDRYHEEIGSYAELELDREQERALVAAGWIEKAADDLDSKTREELDELASSIGVANPSGLPNKQAVIDAIEKKEG